MTIKCLAKHNVLINHSPDLTEFTVEGKQSFAPTHHEINGDYSAASFLIAAASLTGSTITLEGIPEDPLQGDSGILEVAVKMGARIERKDSIVIVNSGPDRLLPIDIDVRQTPDIVPPIVAMASCADGDSRIAGVGRLRYKESNRVERLVSEFGKLGAEAKVVDDSLVISGADSLSGGRVDPAGDHRIAMALAVAGLRARGETEIVGADCVSKSYPVFFHDLAGLGGRVTL
jgi:3-phosphoshikimate 1-carboxyvinyltransferase